MINYFKAAERLLAQRGNLEQALENLGRRRELASTQAKAERDNIKPRPMPRAAVSTRTPPPAWNWPR